jgi:hypothetical protein
MKALLLAILLLEGCASRPVEKPLEEPVSEAPAAVPLSVIFYEYCDQRKMAVVNMTDGDYEIIHEDKLASNPGLIPQLEKLPHTTIYLSSAEVCGCFT